MAMDFKTLVRTEHLNHNHCLFGGYMLLWVDEYAFIAATEEFPSAHFVTRAMEAASFEESVSDSSILNFHLERVKTGRTSVTYLVTVTAMDLPTGAQRQVFQTRVTMCNVGPDGQKRPLPPEKRPED